MTLTPIPPGRGRWRLTLHRRTFTPATPSSTLITELLGARSRRLEQAWCAPAKLTATLDGRSDAAAELRELESDLYAWRWSEELGHDVPYFQGVVSLTEDQLTTEKHTLNVTAFDYLAMVNRRYLTRSLIYSSPTSADEIVFSLLDRATTALPSTSPPANFAPGSYVPLTFAACAPDGELRVYGTMPARLRSYVGNKSIGEAIDQLAKVSGGFDYDAFVPDDPTATIGWLRVFYPQQGVESDVVLEYGGAVAGLTRTTNTSAYSNYWRVLGNNGTDDPAAAQMFSERFNADANDVGRIPVGLWQSIDSGSADTVVQSTLDEQAQGNLNRSGLLVPAYTVTLRRNLFTHGMLNIGDTAPLVVHSGRLRVDGTPVRILGRNFSIDDDGSELVELVVGQPVESLADLLSATTSAVDALTRR